MSEVPPSAGDSWRRDDGESAVAVLHDLRVRRRERRLGRLEWFDVAYKAYLVLLFGGGAVLWLTGLVGDAPVTSGLADVLADGRAVVSLAAAVAVFVGLRSGARGGPLAIEAADVAHVLLAPLPRRTVLRLPLLQRLRTAVLAGLSLGAITGRLVAQRLPGSPWAWAAAGATAGALIGALWCGAALVAHARPRWIVTGVGSLLVAWHAADAMGTVPAPLHGIGALAMSAAPDTGTASVGTASVGTGSLDVAWMAAAVAIVIVLLAIGMASLERMSLEALARRSALVGQLRFAATMQDLRTVVVLRRQLDEEHPRHVPWIRRPVSAGAAPMSIGRAVWRRDVDGLLRMPASRLVRMVVLSASWGIAVALVLRGTTPAIVAAGLAGFVLGMEAIEPLSQEIDRADRCDLLPVERGDLMLRHLAAPAAMLVPFALLGTLVAALASGDAAGLVVPLLAVSLPLVWAAAMGAVVSAVRDAPDPVATVRGPTSIAMPEVTGLGTALRAVLPPAVSTLGVAMVLFVRSAAASGGSAVGASLRAAAGALVLVFLVSQWVRLRDRAHRSTASFLAEGRAASRLGPGGV